MLITLEDTLVEYLIQHKTSLHIDEKFQINKIVKEKVSNAKLAISYWRKFLLKENFSFEKDLFFYKKIIEYGIDYYTNPANLRYILLSCGYKESTVDGTINRFSLKLSIVKNESVFEEIVNSPSVYKHNVKNVIDNITWLQNELDSIKENFVI